LVPLFYRKPARCIHRSFQPPFYPFSRHLALFYGATQNFWGISMPLHWQRDRKGRVERRLHTLDYYIKVAV
jgi:hypothetical protein